MQVKYFFLVDIMNCLPRNQIQIHKMSIDAFKTWILLFPLILSTKLFKKLSSKLSMNMFLNFLLMLGREHFKLECFSFLHWSFPKILSEKLTLKLSTDAWPWTFKTRMLFFSSLIFYQQSFIKLSSKLSEKLSLKLSTDVWSWTFKTRMLLFWSRSQFCVKWAENSAQTLLLRSTVVSISFDFIESIRLWS